MTITLDAVSSADILAFFLVLTRIGAVCIMAPMTAGRSIPVRVKLAVAVAASFVLTPLAAGHIDQLPTGALEITALFFKEAMVGLAIGMAAGAVVAAFQLAGGYIDLNSGFSAATIFDPVGGVQVTLLQQLYGLTATMLFLAIGGEEILIDAIAASFQAIPIDAVPPAADFGAIAEMTITGIFRAGLGIVAPIMIALLVIEFAFGLISRAAPQTQILQVEFPVKIFAALTLIAACVPFMASPLADMLRRMLTSAVGGGG